jgi:hypothetical protein
LGNIVLCVYIRYLVNKSALVHMLETRSTGSTGMEDGVGRGQQPPPDDDAMAFHAIVAASVKNSKPQSSKFIKKLDENPKVSLPLSSSTKKALPLADQNLIGQFTSI